MIRKDLLISLWLANDFIVPLDDGQKIEDAAEEYYSILLKRCFFQDVEFDIYGEIFSCKIHDLMHDVAQKVAGREICISNLVNDDVLKKSRHVAYVDHYRLSSSNSSKTHIRSYLHSEPEIFRYPIMDQACLEGILANWMYLRVLDLTHSGIESLPETIGELLHLRYLDLSWNSGLKVLPESISKLYNLQTLKLFGCLGLKELPKDIKKLVNLRTLVTRGCDILNMPEGLGELSCLQVLSVFVIDGSNLSKKQWCNQLGELRKLDSLKGELEVRIKVGENCIDATEDGRREEAYLSGKQHLNHLMIGFMESGSYEEGTVRLLEELQPHPNLKSLELRGYEDPMMRMPGWANNLSTSLPNLTFLKVGSSNVKYLTCLGNLPHLKELELCDLKNLEYMYEESAVASSNETTTSMPHGLPQGFVLFPCLESLNLESLPKLKGWGDSRVGVGDNKQQQQQDTVNTAFPQLKLLKIDECPDLIGIPLCPNLKQLSLYGFNRKLQLITFGNLIDDEIKEASAAPPPPSSYNLSKLRDIDTDDVSGLNSFPRETFQCLSRIDIDDDKEVESLGEAEEVFRGCSSSLETLVISNCPNLKRIWSRGLEHLIALQVLDLNRCSNVRLLGEEEKEDGISMSRLPQLNSLRELGLSCHQQLADLENWIQFLVTLQSLTIYDCKGLESLPNWMPKLTSLRELHLWNCSEHLKKRCQHTIGQDWPYIQHIPTIEFHD